MDDEQGATDDGRSGLPDGLLRRLVELRSNPHVVDVSTTPFFTPDECAAVVAALDPGRWERMRVWHPGGDSVNPNQSVESADVRRGRMQPVPGGINGPLATRVAARVLQVNDEVYRFRVVGVEDPVQVLWYGSDDADRYHHHMDVGPATSLRKLSFSLLLSDPDTFEGGDLCFGDPFPLARHQGTLTVFPSFLDHAVAPVTAGDRFAIVGFVLGPAFS